MIIPKKLKIGGHIFDVDCSKELDGMNGQTTWKKSLIEIDNAIPQSQKESTLIHEIFHVINSTLGDEDMGHALQDSLSEQLYQVLKDNNLLK